MTQELLGTKIEQNLKRIRLQLLAHLDEVQAILAIIPEELKEHRPHKVVEIITKHFGLSPQDIYKRDRSHRVLIVRHVAQYILRTVTDWSLKDIGAATGINNSTTVMVSIRKVEKMRQANPEFDARLRNLISEAVGDDICSRCDAPRHPGRCKHELKHEVLTH